MSYEPPVIQSAQSALTNLNGVGTAFITTVIAQPAGSTTNTIYVFAPTNNPNSGPIQNQWFELPPIEAFNQQGQAIAPPVFPYWNFIQQFKDLSSQGNS